MAPTSLRIALLNDLLRSLLSSLLRPSLLSFLFSMEFFNWKSDSDIILILYNFHDVIMPSMKVFILFILI